MKNHNKNFATIVCNRWLYRRPLSWFIFNNPKKLNENILLFEELHNNDSFICLICDKKWKTSAIPFQAVDNKISVKGLSS